jgi:transcriptional regulator with XRE-family HTH domain
VRNSFLRQWREVAGLTEAQVERILGWPAGLVSSLEGGRYAAGEVMLQQLARLYQGQPAALLAEPPLSRFPPEFRQQAQIARARQRASNEA